MPFTISALRPARNAALFAIAAAPSASFAEVQATRQNTKAWIVRACMNGVNDKGRDAISQRGKTLTEVCECTGARMWDKFPSIYYWVQETTPYERNQVNEEFPKALVACIIE